MQMWIYIFKFPLKIDYWNMFAVIQEDYQYITEYKGIR